MKLAYNIHYEVAASIFMFFMVVYVGLQYNLKEYRNKSFYRMMIFVLGADIMDIVTAVSISYADVIPNTVNMWLNSIYFILAIMLSYQFVMYSIACCGWTEKLRYIRMMCSIYLIGFFGVLFANLFTGAVFGFDEGKYIHGEIYYFIYLGPYVLFLLASVFMFIYSIKLDWKKRISIFMFFLFSIVGVFFQIMIFPNVLINIFAISVASVIIMFSLENQEYQQLVLAMEELKVLNREVNEVMNVKSQFSETISEKIRNPVKKMIRHCENMIESKDSEICQEEIQAVLEAGVMIMCKLDQILEYSDILLKDTQIENEIYSTKAMLETCSHMLLCKIRNKGIEFEMKIEKGTPEMLKGDRDHISLIIRKLLENAYKFTNEGKIILKAQTKEITERKTMLIVSVEDSGDGIPQQDIPKIFEDVKIKKSDPENEIGSAITEIIERTENLEQDTLELSLAYAKGLAQLMGGDVGVYSEVGKGSIFYVEIPQEIVLEA